MFPVIIISFQFCFYLFIFLFKIDMKTKKPIIAATRMTRASIFAFNPDINTSHC